MQVLGPLEVADVVPQHRGDVVVGSRQGGLHDGLPLRVPLEGVCLFVDEHLDDVKRSLGHRLVQAVRSGTELQQHLHSLGIALQHRLRDRRDGSALVEVGLVVRDQPRDLRGERLGGLLGVQNHAAAQGSAAMVVHRVQVRSAAKKHLSGAHVLLQASEHQGRTAQGAAGVGVGGGLNDLSENPRAIGYLRLGGQHVRERHVLVVAEGPDGRVHGSAGLDEAPHETQVPTHRRLLKVIGANARRHAVRLALTARRAPVRGHQRRQVCHAVAELRGRQDGLRLASGGPGFSIIYALRLPWQPPPHQEACTPDTG
mmetsp:Transcript_27170/g.84523  ORF Transcript_27170/g.84523 Transcript_27170/m.84523 type:complete len:313 (+) Transcript_27170:2674-3612(+)